MGVLTEWEVFEYTVLQIWVKINGKWRISSSIQTDMNIVGRTFKVVTAANTDLKREIDKVGFRLNVAKD